jgi:putative aldouronate transport system substrate-binding protein
MGRNSLVAILAIMLAVSTTACSTATPTVTQQPVASPSVEAKDPFGPFPETVAISVALAADPAEKFPDGDSADNNQYTRYLKEKLNIAVSFSWITSVADWNQKVNLSIASNDIPDGLVVNAVQFRALAQAGMLEDLTDAYNAYASPVMKACIDKTGGKALEGVTLNGKMLALPNTNPLDDSFPLVWVRQDWLDKLDLQGPKTIEDMETIAKAFMDKDPGGNGAGKTIGLAGPPNGEPQIWGSMFGFAPVFSACEAAPGMWIKDAQGKAVYGSILPENKTALGILRDMYSQGLIDPQMGIRKDSNEVVVSGQAGMFCGLWWNGYYPFPDALNLNPKANWQAYMIQDSKGKLNTSMLPLTSVYGVIRKGYEHPEALIMMNNLLLKDQQAFDVSKGSFENYPLRVVFSDTVDVQTTYHALTDLLSGKAKAEDFNDPKYDINYLLKMDLAAVKKVKNAPYDDMNIGTWNTAGDPDFPRLYSVLVGAKPFSTQTVNQIYSITYTQTKTMETKWVNLYKLEAETFIKIVMGEAPLDSFDTFVANWKAQGGDEITEEVQQIADGS